MSVPLDRLYNFLNDICNRDDLIIYRFLPHGSKKISDLSLLSNYVDYYNACIFHNDFFAAICNDQEPLNYDLYNSDQVVDEFCQIRNYTNDSSELLLSRRKSIKSLIARGNIKSTIDLSLCNMPVILIHSEKRSQNLNKYEQTKYIGVYYWCHAVIARDWFRYANHDKFLHRPKTITHDFLIYNRSWSGTREYRLKFVELLVQNDLDNHCMTWFNSIDDGLNYCDYKFKNPGLEITNFNLEDSFNPTVADSSASADYHAPDYQCTNMEIVLETLFDDDRLHLTEKTLRPIACAQPFILAATAGSLEYLRSYGFETFGELIDESYDLIQNPLERLHAICAEMKRISLLDPEQKKQLFDKMQQIAQKNQQRFFSNQWHQSIVDEFKQNFDCAYQQLKLA
jgi:hypothetical protein